MIIFLYGSDSYRLKQDRDKFVDRYRTKYQSGVDLLSFDFSGSSDFDSLSGALRTNSFFEDHKLVVCKDIFIKKNLTEQIIDLLKKQNFSSLENTTLIIAENMSEKELKAKNGTLFKFLIESGSLVKSFEPLVNRELNLWIKKEFSDRGYMIDSKAAEKLIEITNNDSWALINEIEKLCSFGVKTITSEDIENLVAKKIDPNIFDLIDAIAEKNRNKAVAILFRELKNGQDPYYILTMINYQLRNIAIIGNLKDRGFSQIEISKKTGLHPFVVKKTLKISSAYSMDELKFYYAKLLDLDLKSKKGLVNIVDHLYHLVGA